MAAVTLVGTTTGTDASSGGPFSVDKPTGVQENDVLVVFGASNEGAWDTLPSGFTQFLVSTDADTPNAFRCYGWYKICGSSEPASYSFGSTTAATGSAPMVVAITAWRNVEIGDGSPIEANSVAVASGASAEPANPVLSHTRGDVQHAVYVRFCRSTTAIPTFTIDESLSWRELADVGEFSGGSVRYGLGVFHWLNDLSAGGTSSEGVVTCSTTETDNVYFLLGIRTGEDVASVFGNRIIAMRAAQIRAHYW